MLGSRPRTLTTNELGMKEKGIGMTTTAKRQPLTAEQEQVAQEEQRARDAETLSLPGMRQMDHVQAEELRWIWQPYIPAGKLTMLEGDPGLGKSWITCDIAARLSTGAPFPGEEHTRPPSKVIMLSAEDGLGETLQPRLTILGADMERIWASDEHFTLDEIGMRKMEATLARTEATIVFLDPIVGYMGAKIDMHKANEVRGLMASLAQTAKRTGSAIVAVRHLRKAGGTNAIYRGIGSIDFTAAARSALQVGVTKTGKRFMEHIKHNLSAPGPTLGYTVTPELGKFEWTGGMDWSVEEKPQRRTSTKPKTDVKAFLHEVLKDGPRPAMEVVDLAKEHMIGETRLHKEKIGLVVSAKVGKTWMWSLNIIPPSDDPLLLEALARIGRGNG